MTAPPDVTTPTPDPGGTRVVRLAGADNVRDLGGLVGADGRHVRSGRLLRGDLLTGLTDADARVLVGDLGIRTVVDLRTRGEVRHQVGEWLGHEVAWVHCPVHLGGFAAVPGPDDDYVAGYLGFLDRRPEPLLLAVRTLLDERARPAFFHCAAGKDRTGVVAAILLDLLGVPAEAIADDYALTGTAIGRVLDRLRRGEPYRRTLVGAIADEHRPRRETMLDFLAALRERHGGAHHWLADHGVPEADVERFRTEMLVAPGAA